MCSDIYEIKNSTVVTGPANRNFGVLSGEFFIIECVAGFWIDQEIRQKQMNITCASTGEYDPPFTRCIRKFVCLCVCVLKCRFGRRKNNRHESNYSAILFK